VRKAPHKKNRSGKLLGKKKKKPHGGGGKGALLKQKKKGAKKGQKNAPKYEDLEGLADRRSCLRGNARSKERTSRNGKHPFRRGNERRGDNRYWRRKGKGDHDGKNVLLRAGLIQEVNKKIA